MTPKLEPLQEIPAKWADPDPKLLHKLPRYVGPKSNKGQNKRHCNECGGYHDHPAIHLDYMGHAEITLALIEIDPLFDYGWPTDEHGVPVILREGSRFVLWGWLELHGKRRQCVGTCGADKAEPEKELIGDLLRNGAMRFGIATGLWSKSDRADRQSDTTPNTPTEDEEPHPLSERVTEVRAEVKALTDELRAEMEQWAGEGRWPLTAPALLNDEAWLEHVEAWLDEHRMEAGE